MKESTLKITTGAMFIAIFGIMLLLNRQTGGLFEEGILYFLPIPMVAYSAKYGWKAGIPVFIAMCLTTIFCSTPTAIFYAGTEALLGLIFGGCIYRKIDMTKTMLTVMGMSAVFNVLNTIVLAGLFGNDLASQIDVFRDTMVEAMNKAQEYYPAGQNIPDFTSMLTTSFLTRMMIISMIVFGLFQGFLIYQISLLILRRLRFSFPRPKSIYEIYPPRWTGFLALACFFAYYYCTMKVTDETILTISQTVGMCGFLYLAIFGALAVVLVLRSWIPSRIIRVVIAFLLYLMMSQAAMILGFFYIGLDYHSRWMPKAAGTAGEKETKGENREGRGNGERREYSVTERTEKPTPGQRTEYGSRPTGNTKKTSITAIANRRLMDDDE